MSAPPEFTIILYQAMESSFGLKVEVGDFERGRQHFYTARREAGDQELSRLQFRKSPHSPSELWIVKGPAKAQGE